MPQSKWPISRSRICYNQSLHTSLQKKKWCCATLDACHFSKDYVIIGNVRLCRKVQQNGNGWLLSAHRQHQHELHLTSCLSQDFVGFKVPTSIRLTNSQKKLLKIFHQKRADLEKDLIIRTISRYQKWRKLQIETVLIILEVSWWLTEREKSHHHIMLFQMSSRMCMGVVFCIKQFCHNICCRSYYTSQAFTIEKEIEIEAIPVEAERKFHTHNDNALPEV